ncbi:DUF222 domain-containing protein [Geodermatophilus africanus]|nr:DUF222 domain-containing protein [Geodermatophilus africanus]
MATTTADDPWLRELLLRGDWHPDGDRAEGMAAVLASGDPAVDGSGGVTRALLSALGAAWERGWQPADVVHAVRRRCPARSARLVVALVAEDARATDAASRAPAVWVDQLRELGALRAGEPAVVAAWHRAEGRPAEEAWRAVLLLAGALTGLARLDQLVPPPSRWGARARRPAVAPGPDDARVLRRVRALLAKAESTEYAEEAEALTAKAQELMTRLVWYPGLGIVNLVGVAADLDAVELLFTSLLLQAGQALAAAERTAGRRSVSRSFRRAFLVGYAGRVGERLTSARERATSEAAADQGVDLLPALRSRQEAVDDAFTELFPRVRSTRSRSSMDAGGWWPGARPPTPRTSGRATRPCAEARRSRGDLPPQVLPRCTSPRERPRSSSTVLTPPHEWPLSPSRNATPRRSRWNPVPRGHRRPATSGKGRVRQRAPAPPPRADVHPGRSRENVRVPRSRPTTGPPQDPPVRPLQCAHVSPLTSRFCPWHALPSEHLIEKEAPCPSSAAHPTHPAARCPTWPGRSPPAVRLAAATATWLRLVAEFDERDGWHGWGIRSCAQWLSWQCGLAPGAAREHVRVARALRTLPLTEAAFADGRLSYSKVRALTRIAEPDTEETLLDLATETTAAQLERFVRSWRRADADDADDPPDRPEPQERFEYWWDEDGMLNARLRMRPEQGTDLIIAVESEAERQARRERAQNARARTAAHPPGLDWREQQELDRRCADDDEVAGLARQRATARRLAALASLARAGVDRDRRPGDPPGREVVVHIDATELADDTAAGRAHVQGGPALTAAQARRIVCDATVVTMLERGREPLALGRRRRRASKAQRRALLGRDGGCARPGCPETRIERLHAHHLRHWLFGGRTDLDNLVLLCDADHGLVHDLDLVVARVDGRLVVTAPDGRHVWGTADAAFHAGLAGLGDRPAPNVTDVHERSAGAKPTTADPLTGVHPIDVETGRRPALPLDAVLDPGRHPARQRRRTTAGGRGRRSWTRPGGGAARPAPAGPPRSRWPRDRRRVRRAPGVEQTVAAMNRTLFPTGEPPLPDAVHVNGERMDLRYAVGVLMSHRDLIRRLAAEAGST